ncbi:MAG: CCA tRNA nucleotidyltransferase [Candidatus Thorarchaeota archaeon]
MEVIKLVQSILPKGIEAYIVGGYVRDSILGKKSKDVDVEVFGININELEEILSKHGKTKPVGTKFGTIKLIHEGKEFDFSLPRKDSKIGVGHKEFRIETIPSLSIYEAAERRDYTINAMSINIWTQELIDPFGGKLDLKSRILRHISGKFSDDPLRVLRGFQFSGRYNLSVTEETSDLCRKLKSEFYALSVERIWMEFEKWASKSIVPSKGLEFLVKTRWIELFPEIEELIGCEQDPAWHPEGDVFSHTCQVLDKAAMGGLPVVLGALCHDLGKPETTELIEGRIRTKGHANIGMEKTRSLLKRFGCPHYLILQVENLVKEHLTHLQEVNKKTTRRLIIRLGDASVEDLVSLIGADHAGRGTGSVRLPDSAIKLYDLAQDIGNEIKPILMGRHLIELGLEPGPQFGPILKTAFEAQLDDLFTTIEEGINYLKQKKII